MDHYKNFDTVSAFIEVMQKKKLWPLFSGHGVFHLCKSDVSAVQSHPRSLILVATESTYATSY